MTDFDVERLERDLAEAHARIEELEACVRHRDQQIELLRKMGERLARTIDGLRDFPQHYPDDAGGMT